MIFVPKKPRKGGEKPHIEIPLREPAFSADEIKSLKYEIFELGRKFSNSVERDAVATGLCAEKALERLGIGGNAKDYIVNLYSAAAREILSERASLEDFNKQVTPEVIRVIGLEEASQFLTLYVYLVHELNIFGKA